jgi:PAS domain S-box-containing protein
MQPAGQSRPSGRADRDPASGRDTAGHSPDASPVQPSAEAFRALVERSWNAVALLGADATALYASPATARILGYTPEEFVGTNALECVHPDDRPALEALFAELLRRPGASMTRVFRYRHKDGSWRWLEGTSTNLLDEPSVRAIAANFREVHHQRADEQASARLAAIVESSEDAIVGKDLAGNITSWNQAAQRLYGYSAEEVIGKPVALLVPPGRNNEVPDVLRRLQGGERVEHYETVRRRKDGTLVEVAVTISPVRGPDGTVVGASAIARDISERRRAERQQRLLAESGSVLAASLEEHAIPAALTRLVVPSLADYCLIHLVEGTTLRQVAAVHADPARQHLLEELGRIYQPGDHPASRVARVLRTGMPDFVPNFALEMAETVQPSNRLLELVRQIAPRSGIILPLVARGRILGTITLILAESGRIYESADVSFAEELARRAALAIDNARLYGEVRAAGRRKDEWITLLAHELRTPLTPVLNSLHLLRQPGVTEEDARRAGAVIERQIQHMARLVTDLLEVSHLTLGQVQLHRQRLDLARLVRTAAEDRRGAAEQAGLALTVEVPTTPLWVIGDATRLAEVIDNLLDNAIKFTNWGGSVVVRLEDERPRGLASPGSAGQAADRRGVLRIRDTGAGIERDMLPRLFEPLNQADRSLHRTRGGLGLGLALVKGLVVLHGGTVEARSEGPGRGAEFIVRLPLEEEPAALSSPPSPLPIPQKAGGDQRQMASPSPSPAGQRQADGQARRARVLIVEDNRDAAESLRILLDLLGYEVRVAHTGPDGVSAARAWRPEVVLCDIGLPGLDGYGVAGALRRDPATSSVRLIAITGYGGDEDRRRSRAAGFDLHLTKPVDPADLQGLLARPS